MEPSTSKHADTSRIKIKEEPIEDPFENRPKSKRKKQLPRSECKKIFPSRSNCQEWIASNEKYLQSKAEKEAKRKRKREEKKSPGRWTRSDETKLLAEKHKRIKKQQADNQQTTKNEDKGKEEVVDVEQESEMNERLEKQKQAETEKKIKNKGKEKVVDVEDESETNERVQKQSFNRVLKGRATVRPLFEAMRGLTPQRKRVVREMGFGNLIDFPIVEIPTKLAFYVKCASVSKVYWSKTKKKRMVSTMGSDVLEGNQEKSTSIQKLEHKAVEKKEISELQNYYMGIAEILDDVGEKEENEEKEVIFKEPNIPEYHSSSSTESDDDDDDNSQVGDDNEKSYGTQTDSVEEDHVQIVTETQQEEKNNLQYNDEENDEKGVYQSEDELMRAECNEKKDEQETGTSKEADNIKEERKANKKATNQKINEEIDPFDDPTFGEYYLQNEHLFVPTQTSAEKKKDQTDDVNWDSFLENEEEIIRKGREFSAELRKKAQQQEREQKRKGKRENDQIGSSSQESPVFGIDNSLQGSQPQFDLGASPTYEKMKILSEKKKKMGLKSKYVNKTVDPAVELTEDEKLLGRSIFSTQEEEE
ncbi:hypothetical protein Tco_0812068 [Tanacetum coccineum]